MTGREGAALLHGPGFDEQLLQLGNHWPFDPQISVAPRQFTPRTDLGSQTERAARVNAADVDATEEGNFPVDDQQFAMVALVHVPAGVGGHRIDRVVFQDLDPCCGKPIEKL
ncbi:hypothetical protein D9M72_508500 [compost metagenome]